jgi:hypothetical protein
MVQIVCFGGNMLWRHMKVAFRSAKGDTGTPARLKCNPLLNHAFGDFQLGSQVSGSRGFARERKQGWFLPIQ